MMENQIEFTEAIRQSEIRYWHKIHPDAKVKYNKRKHQIEIIYPLPKDFVKLKNLILNLKIKR